MWVKYKRFADFKCGPTRKHTKLYDHYYFQSYYIMLSAVLKQKAKVSLYVYINTFLLNHELHSFLK